MDLMDRYNRSRSNHLYVDQKIDLPDGTSFKITDSGLAAAGHRAGQEWVKKYLNFQRENFGSGDINALIVFGRGDPRYDKDTYDHFKWVQDRLQGFEGTPYRKPH
jgi:hypothetical protein